MGKTFHMGMSATADRFSDGYIRKHLLPGLIFDGRQPTLAEFKDACSEARSKGYEVIPPCDRINDKGRCIGHEEG